MTAMCTMDKLPCLQLLAVFISLLLPPSCTSTITVDKPVVVDVPTDEAYLFYTSPEHASPKQPAGLYGGAVDHRLDGAETDLRRYGYACALVPPGRQGDTPKPRTPLRLRSLSFDRHTRRALLQTHHEDDSHFSVLSVSACQPLVAYSTNCDNQTDAVFSFKRAQIQQGMRPGPFAAYNSRVFFVLQRVEPSGGERTAMKLMRLELRELKAPESKRRECEDQYPVTASSTFDLVECSQLVSTIVETQYTRHQPYRSMDNILIVPWKNNLLDIYVQIQRVEYNDNGVSSSVTSLAVVLYHLRLAINAQGPSPPMERLHQEPLNEEYLKYIMFQLGGLSYKDDVLCWSTVDKVLCGRRNADGNVVDARVYLNSSGIASVCKGNDILGRVVTGVAIASANSASGDLSFYFGCVAQTSGMGGAGLVRTKLGVSLEPRVHNLFDKGSAVVAESMFYTDACAPKYASERLTDIAVVTSATNVVVVLWTTSLALIATSGG